MTRYIDADELDLEYYDLSIHGTMAVKSVLEVFKNLLDKQPTADVVSMETYQQVRWERDLAIKQLQSYGVGFAEDKELAEVKHGEWIEWYPPKEYIMTSEEKLYCCSNCDAKYEDVEGYKYCPFCGAKMDGGEAE